MLYEVILFGIVFLCFVNSLGGFKNSLCKKDTFYLQLAMLFTVCADLCLIILNKYVEGVLFFCVVQLLYAYRHNEKKGMLRSLVFGCILFSLSYFFITKDIIISIGCMYAVLLCASVKAAIHGYKKYPCPNRFMILWGIILFVLCDINVALQYMGLSKRFLIWIFYLPSQILLSSSGYNFSDMKMSVFVFIRNGVFIRHR